MLILTRKDILQVFSMRDAIEADKEAFVLHTQGKAAVPLRINLDNEANNGQIMFMPAYVGGRLNAGGVKMVSCFLGNREKGLPVIPATMAVIDGTTGLVSAILDGTTLTQLRTAAIAGAAADLLANADATTGALFGTGGQAPAQLEALMTARRLKEVRVYDALEGRAKDFAAQMKPLADKFGAELVPAETPKEAVSGADVITTVTTAAEPVFDAADVKSGCHITGVGSYTPDKRELPLELLRRASRVFVDNREAVLAEAGDFIIPMKQGLFSKDEIAGELGELILGRVEGRIGHDDVTVMKTVGFATLDVVAAAEIVGKARKAGVGTEIDL
ncbi:MAG: ornithine cyclodeaminase family protein [Synergistes jonesii]|uniref:ornithine cyclodeaminase family protein n=1 Tax=Synergistes jonesii TaxID=2754 RepID=UPI002A758830|nr:ornithine cyclodeaminase family protein [Synergistes jonesii]MDY2985184.1 ornithine cyclodeaminase family protein [Synergistes jonesii]